MPTPVYLGEIGTNYVVTSASTQTITTTAEVPAGATLFVTSRAGFSIFVSSVTDSNSNTYRLVSKSTGVNTASMFATRLPVALASGSSITVTYSGTTGVIQSNAFAFTDLTLDGTVSATTPANGTSATTGSVTPAQYSGVVISLITFNGTAGAPTLATANGLTAATFTGTQQQGMAYRITNDRTSRSVVWSQATSRNWGSVIVALDAVNSDFLALF
jgi:hypothetical protein